MPCLCYYVLNCTYRCSLFKLSCDCLNIFPTLTYSHSSPTWFSLKYKKKPNSSPTLKQITSGLPWWSNGKESAWQCRRHGFNPWSGKIPHASEQLGLSTATAPVLRAQEPQLLKSTQPELVSAKEATVTRSHRAATREQPHSPQLQEVRTAAKTQHSQKKSK